MEHRISGYNLLRGHGLEIGALDHPAPLPVHCKVDFFDAYTKDQLIKLFPEIAPDPIVDPTYLGDLDKNGLQQFGNEQFDFLILSHVIEHVANPINVIQEIFRIVKYNGHIVIACPDKRFTFDKNRELTSFNHLVSEFQKQVDTVTDEHYIDFLAKVHPHIMDLPEDQIYQHVEKVRARREHAHVWDSQSFKDFMIATLKLIGEESTCIYEVYGDKTKIEYFSVWQRTTRSWLTKFKAFRVLNSWKKSIHYE